MSYLEDRLKTEIIPKLPDVSALPENLYLYYFAALHSSFEYCERLYSEPLDYIKPVFTRLATVLDEKFKSSARITTPIKSFLPNQYIYMGDETLFHLPTPYPLTNERRYSHTWICARQGSGKTTLLEDLIEPDLYDIKARKCAVVVMDSEGQNELLGRIQKWKILDEIPYRLIDSTTPMNPFVVGKRRFINDKEKEIFTTNATAMINFIFSASNGESGNFTSMQTGLFDKCVELLLALPGATIQDLFFLLEPKGGLDRYMQILPYLSDDTQYFFTNIFNSGIYKETKGQIVTRITGVTNNPAIKRMLMAPSAVDFYQELSKPQLILVDTDKLLHSNRGTEIFGRYVIAQLDFAAKQRALDQRESRLPVFAYIDECADYIANDETIGHIIDHTRKMKIGFTFAHQRESHIKSPGILDALRNCEIQFTAAGNFQFNMNIQGLPPIVVYAPLVEREKRAPPKQSPRFSTVPPLEGEIVPPSRPTSQDNRQIPFHSIDDIDTSSR